MYIRKWSRGIGNDKAVGGRLTICVAIQHLDMLGNSIEPINHVNFIVWKRVKSDKLSCLQHNPDYIIFLYTKDLRWLFISFNEDSKEYVNPKC